MGKDTEAVYTDGKWKFDEKVADCFEDMLERSIPQYSVMRNAVFDLISNKLDAQGGIGYMLDIGCSDGLSLKSFIKHYPNMNFIGIDCSEPMLQKARERFPNNYKVQFRNIDLRTDFPRNHFDVVTSVLSVMFVPIQYRQRIIQNVYDNLYENGMFIMVEKVLGNSATLDDLMVSNYYKMKSDNGYTQEQIDRKKLALEGVQVPVTSNWNVDLLKQAGFRQVDVFWRWMNFVGYIAIK